MRARKALTEQAEAPEPRRDPAQAWADLDAASDTARAKAEARLRTLQAVEALEAAGLTRSRAVADAARAQGVSAKSVWNWLNLIEGVALPDRLAYLVPRSGGGPRSAPLDSDFFALVKSDWLRPEQPSLTACYDRAARVSRAEGKPVPPIQQVRRAIRAQVSKPVKIYWRKGAEALRRFYPHQTRDKTAMQPLECVCGDYHKFDVFVALPGQDAPVRIQMVAFSDVYSGKILGWRLSETANSHTVQLCLGDVIRQWGIPQAALLDNGREFAAKAVTGGTPTRFRFKISDDDIPGLLPLLGVQVMWATPYSGQSKPIERTFRDLCDRVAKHPELAGAYTGNKPDAKPENYGHRAVPLDIFTRVLAEEIEDHNARGGRRSEVAFGRSFNEVFNAGYKTAPIRKATPEQLRLWLLRAEGLRAKADNGELVLHGSRFWSEWMYQIAGQKIAARFDPDDLFAGLDVYDLKGRRLGHAACMAPGGFRSVEDAREHARRRAAFIRTERDTARAAKDMDAAAIAARLRAAGADVGPGPLPQADVVRLPQPDPRAPRPAPRHAAPDAETEARAAAAITRLADRRAAQDADHDDPAARYARAQDLLAMQAAGQPLTQAQADWLAEYMMSAEYRGFARMHATKDD